MSFKCPHLLFSLIFVTFLSGCEVDSFSLQKILTPIEPLAANQVAWVDFEFHASHSFSLNGKSNTMIVVQVPENWIVIAGYLGDYDEESTSDSGLEFQNMPRAMNPANLKAETGTVKPMKLVTFANTYSGNSPANRGRLLFIPGWTQDDAGTVTGIDTFAQQIKATYGYLDGKEQFQVFSSTTVSDGDFANVPLPAETVSADLIFSGETLNAEGLAPQVEAAYDAISDATNFELPADGHLLNRYGWRIFFSQDKQFGGAPFPSNIHLKIRSNAEQGIDTFSGWVANLDIHQDYYVDIPVLPGNALNVSIRGQLWSYIKAVPLIVQVEPPPSIDASGEDLLRVEKTLLVSGHISLPEGHTAPAGGIDINLANGLVTIPEGANSAEYTTTIEEGSELAFNCSRNCGDYFRGEQYYSNNGGSFGGYEATPVTRDMQGNLELSLSELWPIQVRGTVTLGGERVAPPGGMEFTIQLASDPSVTDTRFISEGRRKASFFIQTRAKPSSAFTLSAYCTNEDNCLPIHVTAMNISHRQGGY